MFAALNLALRFLLELAAVAAFAAASNALAPEPFKVVASIAAVAVFVVVWGLWMAPRARYPQRAPIRLVLGTIILEIAALALIASGGTALGAILAILILVNAVAIGMTGASAEDLVPGTR